MSVQDNTVFFAMVNCNRQTQTVHAIHLSLFSSNTSSSNKASGGHDAAARCAYDCTMQ